MDKHLLSRCEAEALHLSGAIQPHGSLLVTTAGGTVTHVARNIEPFFPDRRAVDWLDQPLPSDLLNLAATLPPEAGSRLALSARAECATGLLDVIVSRGPSGQLVWELLPHLPAAGLPSTTMPNDLPQDAASLAASRRRITENIAALTGFQRVLYYQFREEGDGEVIAEVHDPTAYGSYLGLRFPASDIPQIARALYLKNPWRMIPDARCEPVPILGRQPAPPDLTWSDLRSVSPVHRVYLANMGVVASLSFPIVTGGNLVALIAAHHNQPRLLPLAVLETAAAWVRQHAHGCASFQSLHRMRLVDSLQYRFGTVVDLLRRCGALETAWSELAPWLLREFQCDGAMLVEGERLLSLGQVFEPAALAAVDEAFCRQRELIWMCDSLRRALAGYPLSAIAGVLALRLGSSSAPTGPRLYLTRSEHVYEVAWGGNPDKPVEYHDGELGIAPRRSFEKWIEKRLGYCRPWDNETRLLALKLREMLQRELHALGT